jgi:hypothetical protein
MESDSSEEKLKSRQDYNTWDEAFESWTLKENSGTIFAHVFESKEDKGR